MPNESRILRLEKITHSRLKALDPEKTAVIATISPIEVHGPHLPLGQDWFEAAALVEHASKKAIEKWPDWTILIVPPIPVGCDTIPHLGSVNFPAPLVRDVAFYTLRPFAERGFARLAYSSFHGGPRHFVALEDAADRLSRKYGVAAMSFFSVVASRMAESNIFFDAIKDCADRKISLEQVEKDLHAGFVETSIGLHLWPELVEEGWEELPPLVPGKGEDPHKTLLHGGNAKEDVLSQIKKAKAGINAVADAIKHYKKHIYAGYPDLASCEQGKLLFDHLVDVAIEIVDEFLGKGRKMEVHSPIWGLREALLNPAVNTVLEEWFHFYSG